jgi:hypothetical protein
MKLANLEELANAYSCSELQALIDDSACEANEDVHELFLAYVIAKLAQRLEVMNRTADKLVDLIEERFSKCRNDGVAHVQFVEKERR